jgi:hypothetical protein
MRSTYCLFELGELDGELGRFQELSPLLLADAAGDAARHAEHRMDHLAHHGFHHLPVFPADADHLSGDVHPHLLDHAEDVALGRRGRGADDEVRRAEEEKVDVVIFHHERTVGQLTELFGRGRGIDLPEIVDALGRGHVMGRGADAADPRRDAGHLLGWPAQAEGFKPTQLRHLKEGPIDVSLVVEEDLDLSVTLEPGDRIDGDSFSHVIAPVDDANGSKGRWEG